MSSAIKAQKSVQRHQNENCWGHPAGIDD